MTTTQRPRPQQPSGPSTDPAKRGLILVVVAVVIGVILLVKGGGIGVDRTDRDLEITGGDSATTTTSTTEPAPATSVPSSSLKVVALNGAGIDGFAGKAQQVLTVAGYTGTTVGTASRQTATTIVYYAPGYETDAAAVATVFGLPADAVQPMPEGDALAKTSSELPADTNVIVWLGPDIQARVDSATGSSNTTTTSPGSQSSNTTTTSPGSRSSNTTTTSPGSRSSNTTTTVASNSNSNAD